MSDIKEWAYAAYLFPVREINGQKQIAFLVYDNDWHGTIGGRIDGNETPRDAMCREALEELGEWAKSIIDNAIEIPEKYIRKVPDSCVERRCARNEEHTFFVSKVPADIEIKLNQEDLCGCHIEWVGIKELKNDPTQKFRDTRENVRAMISFFENL